LQSTISDCNFAPRTLLRSRSGSIYQFKHSKSNEKFMDVFFWDLP
jgi:hypothetical protein